MITPDLLEFSGCSSREAIPVVDREPVDYWDVPATIQPNHFVHKSLSNWSFNIAIGCSHACRFCYVPSAATIKMGALLERHGIADPDAEWGEYVLLRRWDEKRFLASLRAAEQTPRSLLKPDGNRAIIYCSTTDPYQAIRHSDPARQRELAAAARHVVRRSLELIRDHSTLRVRILTRSLTRDAPPASLDAFTDIALSLPLGILFALGRQSNMPLIKWISVTFIEFIRGVPLITLLFTASLLLNYFLPPGTNFDLILRVIIMVTLFATAYMAEVIRGGLAALPRGQYEAADALGLDYWKAQRLIIMPQALKISIPGIVNTFIGLFKDTTLVVFIGILDPIGRASAIRATSDWQGIYWELFIFIGAVFFVFCFSMSRYSMYLERRLKTDHR